MPALRVISYIFDKKNVSIPMPSIYLTSFSLFWQRKERVLTGSHSRAVKRIATGRAVSHALLKLLRVRTVS